MASDGVKELVAYARELRAPGGAKGFLGAATSALELNVVGWPAVGYPKGVDEVGRSHESLEPYR